MKLNDLPKDKLKAALDRVEQALGSKNTKSAVVATLADMKLCSAGSAGIEKTLLKLAQANSIVTPKFGALMGVTASKTSAPENPEPASQPASETPRPGWVGNESTVPVPQKPTTLSGPVKPVSRPAKKNPEFVMSGIVLRSVSTLQFQPSKKTRISLRDGTTLESFALSENVLRSNARVIEL